MIFFEVFMTNDTVFEMGSTQLRFGTGGTREIGMDLADLGSKRAMVLTDSNLSGLPPVQTVLESLKAEAIDFALFDRVRVEPNDVSFREAISFAEDGKFDAYVAVGGGSTMDTAKAANLYTTYPDEFLAYVNAPIGQGKPVPGPLKPLIAVPTTAGTGSETTGVAIFDLSDRHIKTGIAHRRLRPTLGIVDPDNTRTLPSVVAASTGLDVLCHALESYTALPFHCRPHPERPILRPAYQGSNPISDIWSVKAIELVSRYLIRASADSEDDEARENMLLASSYAGMGFGNAGVHLCHGMSYPVSGMVRSFRPDGFVSDHPIVPHGISVVLNAPAVFRFTGPACPDRHLQGAELLGADSSTLKDPEGEAGDFLADRIVDMMKRLEMPNGLSAVGYTEKDIPDLVEGTLPQHRVTKLSPKPAGKDDLHRLFEDAMVAWE